MSEDTSNSAQLAKSARPALEVFVKDLYGDVSPEEWGPEGVEQHAADLIADILHYVKQHGESDPLDVLDTARRYYEEELDAT